MPATPQDRLYGLTTSVAVKPPVYISADYDITRFGEQTITSKTPTDERTITTTEGMRVLLLGQDNPVENGIWVARRSFWVRATDFNGPRDAVNGTLVFSITGDCWQVEADDPVVIGLSVIHFRPTYPFEANLDIFQRTLRVPEASVSVLPSAEDRAWKGLGFDGAGQPKLQDPAGTGLWGYVPAIGSFEKGSLLTQRFEVLLWESTDEYWRWDGAMPKIVLPGSTPDTAGGRGKGKWLDVTDATLRSDLASTEDGSGGDLSGVKKGRAPEAAALTRTVSNLLLDGVAGLRKNFGAVGDGYHDDTAAFNKWWDCLMDVTYKRRAYEGDEAAIKFMLQKGPLLNIENGVFIYDGPGLNIGNSNAFVFNVRGESALSTKILLPNDGVYLFDFDNNPVHSRLTDMTIHGGLGAVRFKSKARNASSTHDFERLRLSRYNECGISNNSIDMPYFRVNKCVFYGATDKQTIGVCVSGYSAGGFIKDSIFSDNRYGIKLAVGDNGTERNGPATPYLIDHNDFYRTGNRGAVDEDTGEFVRFASYDIWAEPGASETNSGKGIKVTRNKFGQENLISPDAHILIADAYATGTGAGLNGDRHHNEVISTGFFSGARFDGNDVNSTNGSYVAPFLRTFTPNTGNLRFADSYDNGMPSRIVEFSGGITQAQIGGLARSNVFDISHCVALQKGVEPKLISNLNDVFRLIDPLLYYVGHPQSTLVPVGSQQVGFELLYSGPTSSIGLSNATRTSLNNSYGGIFEAAEITMTTSQGRAAATVSGGVAGRKHWIDFDVRRGSSNPVGSVVMEVMNSAGTTSIFRRIILLDSVARWQKVVLPYIPNEDGDIIIRFSSKLYVAGSATNFVIGNLNVYRNEEAVNTGHNSGLRMQWDQQHSLKGTRHEWYDSTGNLRAKNGAPTSVTDGVIISANPVV